MDSKKYITNVGEQQQSGCIHLDHFMADYKIPALRTENFKVLK